MKVSSQLYYTTLLIMCIFLLFACQKNKQICATLISIDSLANINADSAANSFLQISPVQSNFTHEEEAFYNLLQTKINIALKKDIASDSVINSAINYYEKTGNTSQLAYAYFYKAKINFPSGSDSIAILYTLKAIDKANMVHDLPLITETYNHLGTIYLFQNLPQNAYRAFKTANSHTDSIPRGSYYKPLLLRNMARTYHMKSIFSKENSQQLTDTAIAYYNKATKLLVDSTANDLLFSVYRELSTTYAFRNDFPKALKYMEAGKDSSDLMLYYSKKADLFMRMGELDSSYLYLHKCMDDPRLYLKLSVYNQLYYIERTKQNAYKALEYVDTLLALNDSIIVRTIPDKVIDIQKKYNEEKLRSEKAILQMNYEKEKSRTLQTSFIIVVLLFLGTYIYIYSYFKKKKLQQRMLQQKNELLLLNQKIQQWNQQVKLNQKKIHQLEQEKKQIEADLRIVSKEKEAILHEKDEELALYRKQENEISIQKSKYEKLCFVEFKRLFLATSISRKIPAFGVDRVVTDILTPHSQEQLMNVMDEIACNFASRLYILLQESTEKTCLCCLIRLQVKPRYIMVLCDLSKEAYYKQCQRMAETLIGKGSASGLKDYLNTF